MTNSKNLICKFIIVLTVAPLVSSAQFNQAKYDSVIREMNSFTGWKTIDDFFNKTNTKKYKGTEIQVNGNNKVKIKDDVTGKKISFKIYDSLYFGYRCMFKTAVYFAPLKDYGSFCGGSKQLYMFIFPFADKLNYDNEGYVMSGSLKQTTEFTTFTWYIVKDQSTEKTNDIEKAIADLPDLLKKYQEEKAKMDPKDWKKNVFFIHLYYIKEYNKIKGYKNFKL